MRKLPAWPLFPFLCTLLMAEQPPLPQPAALAITHVTVIDTAGGPALPDITVVLAGGRITAIAAKGRVPKGVPAIDGRGKFLIPGLWDMHVHLDYTDYLPLFVANGVTGVRVMWGKPEYKDWQKQIDSGQLIGPRMFVGSAIVDGPKPYWPASVSVSSEAEARQAVIDAKKSGADFVKVYQFLPRDLYLDIADESKKQGIPFEGHVPISVTAEEASRAGQKSFEHLVGVLPAVSTRSGELFEAAQQDLADGMKTRQRFWGKHSAKLRDEMLAGYSEEKAAALSAELKRNGTWQCPTLTLLHMFGYGDDPAFLADPRMKYMPPAIKSYWDPSRVDGKRTPEDFAYMKREFQKDLEVVGAMQRAGVGILAGTDTQNPYSFYGFSLHDELGFLSQAGLTPMQALQAATVNPARFFGVEKDFGTVERGKVADLVLLNANPLEKISNTQKIFAVVYRGKLLDRAALDGILAKAEGLAARPQIGEVLAKTIQAQGIEAAIQQYRELNAKSPEAYDFGEDQFISLGYDLIRQKQYKEAIAILRLGVDGFPNSYNAYDSLGEAYMDNGDKELAIENYKKSVQLNPGNANGVAMLKKLNAQ